MQLLYLQPRKCRAFLTPVIWNLLTSKFAVYSQVFRVKDWWNSQCLWPLIILSRNERILSLWTEVKVLNIAWNAYKYWYFGRYFIYQYLRSISLSYYYRRYRKYLGHIRRRMIITSLPSESSFNLVIEWTWLRTDDIPGIPPVVTTGVPGWGTYPPCLL